MYTRKTFPIKDLFVWSLWDLLKFALISAVPVFLYTFFDFKFLHLPWLPIAVLGTAVAFIVSFKNNASYDRMWEARKIWGGIVNASRSWGIMVNDYISNQHAKSEKLSEEELAAHRRQIIKRHVAWMTAHRYALRSTKPWETAIAKHSNKKYMERHPIPEKRIPLEEALAPNLSEEDLAYVMKKSNKATALISLQSKHIKKLEESGHIWEFSRLEMENMLVEFYTLQGKNERIKNFPYPRQFATLNFCFVWIFIILLPLGVLSAFDEMGQKLLEFTYMECVAWVKPFSETIAKHFVWFTIPFCTILSWVFNAMERVAEVTENPFEGTANDIPITTMSRGIEIDLLEMIDEEDIPDPIPMEHDIQM